MRPRTWLVPERASLGTASAYFGNRLHPMEVSLEGRAVRMTALREGLVVWTQQWPIHLLAGTWTLALWNIDWCKSEAGEIEHSWNAIGTLPPATMIGGVLRRCQPYGFALLLPAASRCDTPRTIGDVTGRVPSGCAVVTGPVDPA